MALLQEFFGFWISFQMREYNRYQCLFLLRRDAAMATDGLGNRAVDPAFHQVSRVGTIRILKKGKKIGQRFTYDIAHAAKLRVSKPAPRVARIHLERVLAFPVFIKPYPAIAAF